MPSEDDMLQPPYGAVLPVGQTGHYQFTPYPPGDQHTSEMQEIARRLDAIDRTLAEILSLVKPRHVVINLDPLAEMHAGNLDVDALVQSVQTTIAKKRSRKGIR